MSDQPPPPPPPNPYDAQPSSPTQPSAAQPSPAQPAYGIAPYGPGPVGKVRPTGMAILLFIVTLGIYGYVWYFQVHEEMKRHRGEGLGGLVAIIIAFVIAPVQAFLTSDEVGKLYEGRGTDKPVDAMTGLWYFPGILLCGIGPIVWFVKTNGALNEYWRSLGAPG